MQWKGRLCEYFFSIWGLYIYGVSDFEFWEWNLKIGILSECEVYRSDIEVFVVSKLSFEVG